MGIVFWLTFGVIGALLSDWMDTAVAWIIDLADAGLDAWQVNDVVHSSSSTAPSPASEAC